MHHQLFAAAPPLMKPVGKWACVNAPPDQLVDYAAHLPHMVRECKLQTNRRILILYRQGPTLEGSCTQQQRSMSDVPGMCVASNLLITC